MRAADGTIVEVFEWVSPEAIAGAHHNPAVLALWKRFEAVCSYETPSSLPEFQNMFSHFEPIRAVRQSTWGRQSCLQPAFWPAGPSGKWDRNL